jgi:2-desacetyl-2-hydroxyethyl bacteriochlorophyllide A dehydrogenase
MAEYVAIPFASPGRNVFRLPEELSFEDGASVEPLSISFFSIKRGQPAEKDTAAVLGAGVIGLNAIQVLKSMGVQRVLATGRRPVRLESAKGCGADVVVDAAKEDVLSAIMGATSGMGVDITAECAGTQETFDQSIEMTRGGGKVILVGVYEQPLAWDPLKAMAKNLTLIGCLGGNFPASIELLRSDKVSTRPFITHRFPLDRAAEAFQVQLRSQEAIKVMIKP